MAPLRSLEELCFDNSYARLPEAFYAKLQPTPFTNPPTLVHFNPDAAALIDLDPAQAGRPEFAGLFGGSLLVPGMEPLAMLYAGHQFGIYVPQLGDGRAILLGEVRSEAGARWELQLKGAGLTPFSRDGDGRAVLRSTIREYLCSEAMQGLGIPTSRALSIVSSEDRVYRERVETGAVLLRMAPSHVRFGTFEVFYYREQYDHLRMLADYVIAQHYPHLGSSPDRYARLFAEVVERTASLIARWQAVGWAHGVLNTDNMSILGLTLDYGPFGFMEEYDPGFICNHSDHNGRYAFDQQPYIGLWNLSCLAQTLLPLAEQEVLKATLDRYTGLYEERYEAEMRRKFGLETVEADDRALLEEWLGILHEQRADYTITWRALGEVSVASDQAPDGLRDLFLNRNRFDAWITQYRHRLAREGSVDLERRARMQRVNPKYILRNYLAQTAIELAQKQDYAEIDRLYRLLRDPYAEHPDLEQYAAPPPNWGKHLMVSCSS